MSQPYNRAARVPAPGKVDDSLGEFWVENPFEFVGEKHNLSCFERDRAYLNVPDGKDRNFVDISHLTGADNDGDGRCAVAADFRNNGQQDLIVRQAGGGPLLLFENRFPLRHYLKVSLRGHPREGQSPTSTRQGIGARLVAVAKGQQLVRELYPINSYRSQAPCLVHFGLGDADRVEKLTIRWPSGREQVLADVAADQHIIVDEDKEGPAAIELVVPGQTMLP